MQTVAEIDAILERDAPAAGFDSDDIDFIQDTDSDNFDDDIEIID